jgi:hypothetical protein
VNGEESGYLQILKRPSWLVGRSFRAPGDKQDELKKFSEKRPSWLHGRRQATEGEEEVNEEFKQLFGKYLNKYFKNIEA